MNNISIIVPTYKRPEYVELCLKSIIGSVGLGSKFEVEVILSDNSPDDSVAEVAKKYKDKLDLVFLPEKTPIFVGESRRRGVEKAKNEIIIFADSDIELGENALSEVIKCITETPSAGMVTTKVFFKKDDQIGEVDRPRKEDRMLEIDGVTYEETNYGRFLCTHRSIFKYLGGYDDVFEKRGEGVDMSCRYWRGGFPIVYCEKSVVYHHHDAPDSLTRLNSGSDRMFASLILMAYKYDIDADTSPYFVEVMNEGKDFQDKKLFDPIHAASSMLDWFNERFDDIKKSKDAIPKEYDFKPQDVFTKQDLVKKCIAEAPDRIRKLL